MEEELVKRLMDFGFTINQAKVYLSIVQSGSTCVSDISAATQLHRQDVYKILPKLEKMGLTTKTVDTPFDIRAIPVERALSRLVSDEKGKAEERILRLKANLKEVINAVKDKQKMGKTREEKRWLIPLLTDAKIENIANHTFENIKTECNLVLDLKLITRLAHRFQKHLQKASIRGAKIRIIVENAQNEDLVKEALEKIKPRKGDVEAKLICKAKSIPYYVIDQKELWISMEQKTESGLPCLLWTNGINLTRFFKERFEESWNHPHAITLYPKKEQPKRLNKRIANA